MTPQGVIAILVSDFDEGGRSDEKISRSLHQKFRDAYRSAGILPTIPNRGSKVVY